MTFQITAVLAEFERNMLIERTPAGLAAARRGGKHLGRRFTLSREHLDHAANYAMLAYLPRQ